jgi:hypothetical protein
VVTETGVVAGRQVEGVLHNSGGAKAAVATQPLASLKACRREGILMRFCYRKLYTAKAMAKNRTMTMTVTVTTQRPKRQPQ